MKKIKYLFLALATVCFIGLYGCKSTPKEEQAAEEVEVYYKQQVNLRYGQIRNMDIFSDSIQRSMLLKELSDMDSIYINLQGELEANPKDKRIINAMIEHYQLKVDVMNQILHQLEQIKNENLIKNKNHESNQI
ncbi:hypothetical protein ES708_26954 [subsurface metagenome]